MAYKNAIAGLDHGGGKGVIIGDPATDKTPDVLRAYGRFVQSVGGRYITACDVGTYVEDMDVVAETCDYVTGRSEAEGGAGDSGLLTAFGVYRAMVAAATFRWSDRGLAGRRLGVIGIGKVGRHLIELAAADGATIIATDVNPEAVQWARRHHPEVELLDSDKALMAADVDVLAPCALGGAITDDNVDTIRATVICGAANNQLEHDGLDARLLERGIVYCPDFVVNSGGVIQVADELARLRPRSSESQDREDLRHHARDPRAGGEQGCDTDRGGDPHRRRADGGRSRRVRRRGVMLLVRRRRPAAAPTDHR